MDEHSIEKILDFAIGKEEEAARLYAGLAEKMTRPGMRETFLGFAREEAGHKQRLIQVKAGKLPAISEEMVLDLGIAELTEDVAPSPEMDYQQALVFAMKAEKAAFKLYSGLAEISDDMALAAVFRTLAQEEAKHKLRFEIEYDDVVLEGV